MARDRKTLTTWTASLAGAAIVAAGLVPATAEDRPIDQIVVTGTVVSRDPVPSTQQVYEGSTVEAARPLSLGDALSLTAGATVQTNSRGESLVFLRNAGERHVAIFLDGAPINVPWDNRLDLDHVPAAAIGRLVVSKGPLSMRYGPNATSAVEIIPATASDAPGLSTTIEGGEDGLFHMSGRMLTGAGATRLILAADHARRSAAPLPEDASLAFQNPGDDRRLNTDSRRTSLLGRGAHEFGNGTAIALTGLSVDARFGIAPEGGPDVGVEDARFWRYPELAHRLVVASARAPFGDASDVGATAWVQDFDQTIESFTGPDYAVVETRQVDRNLALGGRLVAEHGWGESRLVGAVTGLAAEHREQQIDVVSDEAGPDATFRENLLSAGVEYNRALGAAVEVTLGGGWDAMSPTRTGGRPDAGDFSDDTFYAGVRWRPAEAWMLRAAAGRKSRMPTLRELFGEGIGRFVINPELTPEQVDQYEIAVGWTDGAASFEVTPFASIVSHTIDQENVTIDGRRLRRRINLRGSQVYGVEALLAAQVAATLAVRARALVTEVERLQDAPTDPAHLTERPEALLGLELDYDHPSGFGAKLEVEHRGRAYTLAADDSLQPLQTSTTANVELSFAFEDATSGSFRADAFMRIDNVTDDVVEPQRGLIDAGRIGRIGVRLAY